MHIKQVSMAVRECLKMKIHILINTWKKTICILLFQWLWIINGILINCGKVPTRCIGITSLRSTVIAFVKWVLMNLKNSRKTQGRITTKQTAHYLENTLWDHWIQFRLWYQKSVFYESILRQQGKIIHRRKQKVFSLSL